MRQFDSKEQFTDEERPDQDTLTVLDWFKSLFRGKPLSIPDVEEPAPRREGPRQEQTAQEDARPQLGTFPALDGWITPERLRLPAGLFLALGAQLGLARSNGSVGLFVAAYLAAALLVGWAVWAGDVTIPMRVPKERGVLAMQVRWRPLAFGLGIGLLAFLTSFGNQFRAINVVSWVLALLFAFLGLWDGEVAWRGWGKRARGWLSSRTVRLDLSAWHLVFLGAVFLVAYFRYAELTTVPYEMWSDQAEKLLDVRDVLNGDYKIFFPRNTGREPAEFYLAAFTSVVLGTGLSFLTLKLVTATAGFLALFFLYLLAKEIGGREVGLYALVLGGIAFWPNIVSRVGLRMAFTELAVAPAMFFLVRGLRQGRRNDFLWSGLAVGLGLLGYTAARILPLVILVGVLCYLLHVSDRSKRIRALVALGCLILVSALAFTPLLRVLVDRPDEVLYRMMTRMGTIERVYPNHPLLQLAINIWDALKMFAWDTGQTWVITVVNRPGLDWLTGAFFHVGLVLVGYDYVRRRRWESVFVLASLPVLVLPSALALAFPIENPGPNRMTGAIVPVFIIAGYAFAVSAQWVRERVLTDRQRLAYLPMAILLLFAGLANHRLVFDVYAEQQRSNAWNYSEAAEVMRGFADSVGDFDDFYIVAYPHWFDSRIPAIPAGAPIRAYAVFPEELAEQELDPASYHLFLLKPEDVESISMVQDLHPSGTLSRYESAVAGRDFYMYLIPAMSEQPLEPEP